MLVYFTDEKKNCNDFLEFKKMEKIFIWIFLFR